MSKSVKDKAEELGVEFEKHEGSYDPELQTFIKKYRNIEIGSIDGCRILIQGEANQQLEIAASRLEVILKTGIRMQMIRAGVPTSLEPNVETPARAKSLPTIKIKNRDYERQYY